MDKLVAAPDSVAVTPKRERNVRPPHQARQPRAQKNLYAALDLGTNNCRLLIVEPQGKSFRVKDSFSRIVRLGEGLEISGALNEAAMDRTIAALKICAAKIRRLGVRRIRCVATEACRFASNGAAFIKRAQRETGLRLEVINGGDEAALAALGCENLFLRESGSILVFDIGGGSTELTWLRRGDRDRFEIADVASFPLGVVRLAERHAGPQGYEHGYDIILDECLNALRGFAERQSMSKQPLQLIGTSGTVTTLAAVHLGLEQYDRRRVDGCVMQMEDLMSVIGQLRGLSQQELADNKCIGVQRADLVLAGCAVLEAMYRIWPVERVSVADRGLREGILLRMMRRDQRRRRRRSFRREGKSDG